MQFKQFTVSGTLTPAPPFDFDQSLNFLGLFPPTQREQMLTERSLTKATCLAGQPLVFRLKSQGDIEHPRLNYTLFAKQPIDEATHDTALDQVSFFLSLADDLRPFYTIGQADAAFSPVIDQLYGYHQVKFLTPFENACWAILTQRNTLAVARRMKQTIIEKFNFSLVIDGAHYWAFPEPAHVAALSLDELAALLRHQQKAEYLLATAEAFSQVDQAFLRSGPYHEVKAWLQAIKGIGTWSTEFILIRGLGRMEEASFSEKRLLEVINRRYGNGHPISQAKAREFAKPYQTWQGYWAHYLRAAG